MNRLKNWFNIHDEEIGLFLYSSLFLFLIRCSGIIFNNFTETAFLKRFGVEYLPYLFIINPFVTLIIMTRVSRLAGRVSGNRMISFCLIFFSIIIAIFRLILPLHYNFTYPLLFIIKVQVEMLLGLLFWNLANDFYTFGQSKRLFPLITMGGVLGDIVGSLATPVLSHFIDINNFLVVYLVLTMVALFVIQKMNNAFPVSLIAGKKPTTKQGGVFFKKQFQEMGSLMKSSKLVTIMILLTFFSNIILPVMNYQFNFAVDHHFVTENGVINFFGYFRGAINTMSLFFLLFASRLYGKWGLSVVMLFHPINYLMVFLVFLLKFDLFSAIYARFSTNLIRTNFNKPVTNILIGVFPESYRSRIRPFLRGIVARVALIAGSSFILLSEDLFHPRFLSFAALPFVAAWIITIIYLKKHYASILLHLLSINEFNLKFMDRTELKKLLNNKDVREKLVRKLLTAKGKNAVAYADLLKFMKIEDLDSQILSIILDQDEKNMVALLDLISDTPPRETFKILRQLVDVNRKDLTMALCRVANKLAPHERVAFFKKLIQQCTLKTGIVCSFPEIRGFSIGSLCRCEPDNYESTIHTLLNSMEPRELKAGIIAAGKSGMKQFIPALKQLLNTNDNQELIPQLLRSLHDLKYPGIRDISFSYISHDLVDVRLEALEHLEINDEKKLETVICLMGDGSDRIHKLAIDKIKNASYKNSGTLIDSLNSFNKRIKKGLVLLLENFDIKDIDVFNLFKDHLYECYKYILVIDELSNFHDTTAKNLFATHLKERKEERIETVLRIAALKDKSGQMKIISNSFFSQDDRRRSNAVEAMANVMDASLSKILMPLVDDTPVEQVIKTGRKIFRLPEYDHDMSLICSSFLGSKHWVTVSLALTMAVEYKLDNIAGEILETLKISEDHTIRTLARRLINMENYVENQISMQDRIVCIRKVNIFQKLTISDLAAIAAIADEKSCLPGEIVFSEGDVAETMHIVASGEVRLSKNGTFMGQFSSGHGIGFSAFFVDNKRLATCHATKATTLLVIHKMDFYELLMQYPQMAIELIKIQTQRVEHLLNGIEDNIYQNKIL